MKELFNFIMSLFSQETPEQRVKEMSNQDNVPEHKILKMYRTYYDKGVHTRTVFPDGSEMEFACLERPDKDNTPFISCVPEGLYPLGYRESEVVERTSKGKYKKGFEIQDVENRSYIMFHVGNYVSDTEGCVLVGTSFDFIDDDQPVVWQSGVAFIDFMEKMLELMENEETRIEYVSIEKEE
jgi:hypothetical protein